MTAQRCIECKNLSNRSHMAEQIPHNLMIHRSTIHQPALLRTFDGVLIWHPAPGFGLNKSSKHTTPHQTKKPLKYAVITRRHIY
jgi:hypothetical protein